MDNSYFIIRVSKDQILEIYFYSYEKSSNSIQEYPTCFIIKLFSFDQISFLLALHTYILDCSTKHKIYLGKEIFKAQISIKLNQEYIQD